jgi:hypothetical protein
MSDVKDPFQILADELTLIRKDMDQLQRTSLTREEAEALNQQVAYGLTQMRDVGGAVQRAIEARMRDLTGHLTVAADDIRTSTIRAAKEGAGGAIAAHHKEMLEIARDLSKAAGEARREAWRYFGGFWVWLVAMLAVGVILGALTNFGVSGKGDALAFGAHPGLFCTVAGGQVVKQKDGSSFCAIWITQALNPPG